MNIITITTLAMGDSTYIVAPVCTIAIGFVIYFALANKKSIEEEKNTVEKMILIYCKTKHKSKDQLCDECLALKNYALQRLSRCTFGEDKPTCESCPIHCYKASRREQIQEVMRYAGPRMIIYHPVSAIKHVIKNGGIKIK